MFRLQTCERGAAGGGGERETKKEEEALSPLQDGSSRVVSGSQPRSPNQKLNPFVGLSELVRPRVSCFGKSLQASDPNAPDIGIWMHQHSSNSHCCRDLPDWYWIFLDDTLSATHARWQRFAAQNLQTDRG